MAEPLARRDRRDAHVDLRFSYLNVYRSDGGSAGRG